MCLLVYMQEDATPDMEGLLEASYQNSDGFGYAIHNGDSIVTESDMNFDRLANRFLDSRKMYKGMGLFHLRWATHGTTNKMNCHPFFLGGDRNTVVAHNGIMSVSMEAAGNRSDTKVFAEDVMPSIGGILALDDAEYFKRLENHFKGNKLVFLTTNEDALYDSYILNEDEGHWVDGVWYSNYSYEKSLYTWGKSSSYYNKRWNSVTKRYEDLLDDYDDEYGYDSYGHIKWPHKTKQLTAPSLGSRVNSDSGETIKFTYANGWFAIQNGDVRTTYKEDGTQHARVVQKYYSGDNPPIWDTSGGGQKWMYPTSTILIPAPGFKPGTQTTYTSTGRVVREPGKTTTFDLAGKIVHTSYEQGYWDSLTEEAWKLEAAERFNDDRNNNARILPFKVQTPSEFDDEREIFDEHDSLDPALQELFDFVVPFDNPDDGFMAICGSCGAGQTSSKEDLIFTTHCKGCGSCYHCLTKEECECWDELMEATW